MTRSMPLTPAYLAIASEILQWSKDFLIPDNPNMKRQIGESPSNLEAGPVCPFIKPSIDADSFYMVFHPEVNGKVEEDIEDLLVGYIEQFTAMEPHDPEGQLVKALLLIFPEIPEKRHTVLTKAARRAKDRFVAEGLMLAPFYPKCPDKSFHNPTFYTSQAPHPLIAIRHMAIHDILFLSEKETWFDEYNRHFGHRFKDPKKLEEHNKPLRRRYEEAIKKYLS